MKKLFTVTLLMCFTIGLFAQTQTPRTLTWDGTERQYLEYVPALYNPETPAPVIICLHGLGDNMTNFSSVGFNQVADQTGWIVITPQALDAMVMGQNFGAAWNSGAGAENVMYSGIPLGNIILNDGVDDSGFLIAILDSLENHFNINTDSVFFTGFSMGGFMCNRMASEYSDRITAIASVSGTFGKFFTPNPSAPVKSLHIHGTADQTIGYENADLNTGVGIYSVGMGAEELVEYWRNYDVCNVDPIITNFPDTKADGKTFERYIYENGTGGAYTAFIKVIGGDHEWYYNPQNDIDYTTEIYKFLTNTMDFPSSVENSVALSSSIFPNPANNNISILVDNTDNSNISIMDISGKNVLNFNLTETQTNINISDLSQGLYIVKISQNGKVSEEKLVVTR